MQGAFLEIGKLDYCLPIIFFVATRRMLENAILKKIFQSLSLYNTNKSPLRNAFFFFYHKSDWDKE